MAERAKLVFNNERYSDNDLKGIAEKECTFQGFVFDSYKIDRNAQALIVNCFNRGKPFSFIIYFKELKMYKVKSNIIIEHKGHKYSDDTLMRIGNEVASLWGACCFDYKVNKKERTVIFYCNECGEEFGTSVSFDDLEKYKV